MTVPTRAVSVYLTGQGVRSVFDSFPNLDAASPMLAWHLHETAKGVFSTTFENALKADIDLAHDRDKLLLQRPTSGTDAPIGRPGTTRASWLTSRGVGRIRTLDNDASPTLYGKEIYTVDVVTPSSRTAYIADLVDWYERIGTILAANDKGGHPRWTHVPFLPLGGVEDGTEMSQGLGTLGDTVYTACGTVGGSGMDAATKTFTLASPSGGAGSMIYKIGSELLHVLSRSGGTVTVGKRGHCGTPAASHSVGASVSVATAKITNTQFNGYPVSGTAPFDHREVNRRAWMTLAPNVSDWQDGLTTYWHDACLAIADVLPEEVGISIAGGQQFEDGLDGADEVLEAVGPILGPRLVAGTTNWVDNYPASNPNENAWLNRAAEIGNRIFLQTAGITRMHEPPEAGAMERVMRAGVEGAARLPIFYETGRPRFTDRTADGTLKAGPTTSYGFWGGGTVTQREFLVG